jgi:hypothetical protein
MMWYICFFFFFFLDELVLFYNGFIILGPILEVLSFYGKKFWALFKKKKLGLINIFLGPYFRGLKFLWENFLGFI